MADPVLEIEDLSFKYPDYPGLDFPELFKGLNLKVAGGEIRVIFGKPESGKTTLSRIITALIPRYSGGILSGRIKVLGEDLEGKHPYELTDKACTVFQNPDEQIITTRCDAEIAFPMESLGWNKVLIKERMDYGMQCTGIEHLRLRDPSTLSGGEKKKLLLSALFAVDPKLWILDETFEELDPSSVKTILGNILSKDRTVLLFMTKPPSALKQYNVKYSLLYKGTLVHQEDSAEKFSKLMKEEGLILGPGTETGTGKALKEQNPLEPLIKLDSVEYSYNAESTFKLDIENFELKKGEVASIVGKNGSGKSTLGKLLCGLIEPESGEILTHSGSGYSAADTKELNRTAGFIFQNPDYQIFLPTVKEELSYGTSADEETIDRVIDMFNLPGKDVPPTLMSYGARKRLQSAVYYLFEKDLYIVDEADSGLSVDDFRKLIACFNSKNSSVLFITHNMELSRAFSGRVYIMENGKIVNIVETESFHKVDNYFNGGGERSSE